MSAEDWKDTSKATRGNFFTITPTKEIKGWYLLGSKTPKNSVAFSTLREPNRIQRFFMWQVLGFYYITDKEYQKLLSI